VGLSLAADVLERNAQKRMEVNILFFFLLSVLIKIEVRSGILLLMVVHLPQLYTIHETIFRWGPDDIKKEDMDHIIKEQNQFLYEDINGRRFN
jgi:hypothetical protein